MKKLTLLFLLLMAVCAAFQACDDTMTYAEMKEREDNAIDAFIRDSNIVVISQSEFYAQDSMTDVSRNEYVQLASGVYMQIVDKGIEGDTVKNNDEIIVRFSEYNVLNNYLTYSNLESVTMIEGFRYTVTSSSIAGIFLGAEDGYAGYYSNYVLGGSTAVPAGWLVPLDYIHNQAHIKLIVPSDMGTQTAMSSVVPYYYDITYRFYMHYTELSSNP